MVLTFSDPYYIRCLLCTIRPIFSTGRQRDVAHSGCRGEGSWGQYHELVPGFFQTHIQVGDNNVYIGLLGEGRT